jgi:aspartate/methionine/tyrosine aminotransferase
VLEDESHVSVQRDLYRARREMMLPAVRAVGFRVDYSEAGLYLWVTRDGDDWESVTWFSERGILVTPGSFYGVSGAKHVRIALTATDESIARASQRLVA